MLLACNYSRPLLDLLSAHAAEVDYIKLSRADVLTEEMEAARPVRPVLLHTLGRAGEKSAPTHGFSWHRVNQQILRAGSPHVAVHLALHAEDWDEKVDLGFQSPEALQAMWERVRGNILRAREALEVPLLVENIPYYGTRGTVRAVTDPGFVHRLVEETNAGFLLDLAHIRVTSFYLECDPREYLLEMPLDRVREIHISGPASTPDGKLQDRHYEMTGVDYDLLDFALDHTDPAILTLEYGGTGTNFETPQRNDPQALRRQLRVLRRETEGR